MLKNAKPLFVLGTKDGMSLYWGRQHEITVLASSLEAMVLLVSALELGEQFSLPETFSMERVSCFFPPSLL